MFVVISVLKALRPQIGTCPSEIILSSHVWLHAGGWTAWAKIPTILRVLRRLQESLNSILAYCVFVRGNRCEAPGIILKLAAGGLE